MVRQSDRLSAPRIRLFLAVLVQNKNVFKHFESQLSVEHFDSPAYQLLYRVVADYVSSHSDLPTLPALEAELESCLGLDPELLTDEEAQNLTDFLTYAFDPDLFADKPVTSPAVEKAALRTGKQVLLKYEQRTLSQKIQSKTDLSELPVLLAAAQLNLDRINTASQTTKPRLSFEAGFDTNISRITHTTGISFFDKYMAGGAAAGEVYCVFAPYATCKTTLAVMLWCQAARRSYERVLSGMDVDKKGLAVLVTYEAPLSPEIQARALMYAAEIQRQRINQIGSGGLSVLSNSSQPLEYETKMFKPQIETGTFLPERQRVDRVLPYLNEHTLCLDFSGTDTAAPSAGTGGVPEIITQINREIRNRGGQHYVSVVIVDYLSALVAADTTPPLPGTRKQEEHVVLPETVRALGRTVAKPYSCPVWVFQQLSGESNRQTNIIRVQHHTDGKGSKSTAENADFAFTITNLTTEGVGQCACSKARHAARLPPTLIQVNGEFNRVSVTDRYQIDARGHVVSLDNMTAAQAMAGSAPSSSGFVQADETSAADATPDYIENGTV